MNLYPAHTHTHHIIFQIIIIPNIDYQSKLANDLSMKLSLGQIQPNSSKDPNINYKD